LERKTVFAYKYGICNISLLLGKPEQISPPIIISNITAESADVTWMGPNSKYGPKIDNYFIEKNDVQTTRWIKVARVEPDVRTIHVVNLIEGNVYRIRIRAENEYGHSIPLESETFKPSNLFCSTVRNSKLNEDYYSAGSLLSYWLLCFSR
jgi:hypothetical protein